MNRFGLMFVVAVLFIIPIGILEDVGGHKNLSASLTIVAMIFGFVGFFGYLASER